jgi:hypothetical protein
MTETAEMFSLESWWEGVIEKTPVKYICLILGALGGSFLYWAPRDSFRHSLGEAAIIAALLIFLVDPFLKARLLREAAKDIFHHLLGFDQPPEIKKRLQSIVFDTKLFRRDFCMRCSLVPESGNLMRLECECSFDVVNPTSDAISYPHLAQFEKSENPQYRQMTLVSVQENYAKIPKVTDKADDPWVLEANAGETNIQPSSSHITYRFGTDFSLEYPQEFFHAVHFTHPTIGVTIELLPPVGYEAVASPTKTVAGNTWKYEKLFMPAEHVDIRWRKISN